MNKHNVIYNGNALEMLQKISSNSMDCCITSPPYWGLRNYEMEGQIWGGIKTCKHSWNDSTYIRNNDKTAGEKQKTNSGSTKRDNPVESSICKICGAWKGQLGMESSPELFVEHIVSIFREVKRILKSEGTLWLNLGDSYWGGKGKSGQGSPHFQDKRHKEGHSLNYKAQSLTGKGLTRPSDGTHKTIKPKDLVGIPWMIALALKADGWYLRQDIIWHKPNPMPESVKDRCTKSHEYIFLLSKAPVYYFNSEAIRTPLAPSSIARTSKTKSGKNRSVVFGGSKGKNYVPLKEDPNYRNGTEQWGRSYTTRKDETANKKSVWTVTTKAFKGAHFATFPEDLITPCILAGCPEQGVVLDPFMGAGTTAIAALKQNRKYIGIELNPFYCRIAESRIETIVNKAA